VMLIDGNIQLKLVVHLGQLVNS